MSTETIAPQRKHAGGAPLLPPVLAYAVLALLAVALPPILGVTGPWTSTPALLEFYREHTVVAKLDALVLTAAAVPYAVFSAVFSDRIRRAGLDVPGRLILQVGGTVAATMLAVSGMLQLAMTSAHVADSLPVLAMGQGLSTALGGTAFAAFSGLVVAGIAVPGLLGGLLARPVAIIGVVLAVLCELGLLSTLSGSLGFLLPIARFGSLIWLIVAASTLKSTRRTGPNAND